MRKEIKLQDIKHLKDKTKKLKTKSKTEVKNETEAMSQKKMQSLKLYSRT